MKERTPEIIRNAIRPVRERIERVRRGEPHEVLRTVIPADRWEAAKQALAGLNGVEELEADKRDEAKSVIVSTIKDAGLGRYMSVGSVRYERESERVYELMPFAGYEVSVKGDSKAQDFPEDVQVFVRKISLKERILETK